MEFLRDIKESNQILHSSSCIIKYLIQDLLDFAQIKAGKFIKNVRQFDI